MYVKDLKVGEPIHTVFRAALKEKHTSRGGKAYLALSLVDRTGDVDGRVFDNVDAADQAFSVNDYLLVKGKVGQFHGKSQIVIEQLERLDAGPIDQAEFAWVAPPPISPAVSKPSRDDEQHKAKVRLSKRIERLLENPQLVQALDNFLSHFEKSLDPSKVAAAPTAAPSVRPERRERRPRAAQVEHKPTPAGKDGSAPNRFEPKRDPALPEGLAFKPFSALVGEGEKGETQVP